jgi:hypothetical protein
MFWISLAILVLALLCSVFVAHPDADYDKRPFRLISAILYTLFFLSRFFEITNDTEWRMVAVTTAAIVMLTSQLLTHPDFLIAMTFKIFPTKLLFLSMEEGKLTGKLRYPRRSIEEAITLAAAVNDMVYLYLGDIEVRVLKTSGPRFLYYSYRCAQATPEEKIALPFLIPPKRDLGYWWRRFTQSLKYLVSFRKKFL